MRNRSIGVARPHPVSACAACRESQRRSVVAGVLLVTCSVGYARPPRRLVGVATGHRCR